MEKPTHRTWMYNMLLPGRKGYTTEFLKGLKDFIDFACQQPKYLNEGVIRCPCKLCKNVKHLTPEEVNAHIIKEGFTPRYWFWTSHGEKLPHINNDVEVHSVLSRCKNTSELSAAVTMLNMSQACFNDRPRTRSQTRPQPRPPPPPQLTEAQPSAQLTQSQPSPQLTQSQPQTRPRTRSRTQPRPTQPSPQSQSHTTQPTQCQPQPPPPPPPRSQSHTTQSQHIPTQVLRMEEYPMANKAPSSSSSQVSGGNNVNKIMILPEGDGFDQHKLVIGTIASIIRTNMEEAKPSWKKLSIGQRDSWFNIFESKFTWPPKYKDMVRRNFEKRGSAKMTQLMQDVRKNLNQKPTWMEDDVWGQLKAHWESSSFKNKSEINKRNRKSMDGASLHTGGSIPHRLHWKRMKEENGTDPSLAEFYFRTHLRKKDQSWVGPHAESAYDKFEQRKTELSSKSSKFTSGEGGTDSQPSMNHMPSDFDIWADSVGKKKGRIFGLGSIAKTLFTSSSQPTKLSANSEEVYVLRNQIQELNESLQRQEQEQLKMRQELTRTKNQGSTSIASSSQPMKLSANPEEIDALRNQINALNESLQRHVQEKLEMRQELTQTKEQVIALMRHFGFVDSSRPSSSPQHNSVNDDDYSDTISDHID